MGPRIMGVQRMAVVAMAAGGMALSGCAKGTGEDPIDFNSGEYELATIGLEGDCSLDDAISPGPEHVGKLARAQVTVRDNTVRLEICDPFFDSCFATVDEIGLIRQGDVLFAEQPSWVIPSCLCFEEYRGSREVNGFVSDDDTVELSWSFTVPAPPANCHCPEWQACEAKVDQLMTRP